MWKLTNHFLARSPVDFFTKHTVSSNKEKPETSGGLGTTTNTEKLGERSRLPSVTDVKNLQVTEVELQAHDMSEKVLALCDSASSYSWISAYLVLPHTLDALPPQLKMMRHPKPGPLRNLKLGKTLLPLCLFLRCRTILTVSSKTLIPRKLFR